MTIETFSLGACTLSGAILITSLSVAATFGLIRLALSLACTCWDLLMTLMISDEYRRRIIRKIRSQYLEAGPRTATGSGLRKAVRWYFENREKVTRP